MTIVCRRLPDGGYVRAKVVFPDRVIGRVINAIVDVVTGDIRYGIRSNMHKTCFSMTRQVSNHAQPQVLAEESWCPARRPSALLG